MFNWKTLAGGAAVSAIATAAIVQPAGAQITSSDIRGSVVDEAGNSVAGAEITVVHVPTGTTSRAITSANGNFFQSGLRVGGPYAVSVTSPVGGTERGNIFLDPSSNSLTFMVADDTRTLETVVVRGEVGSRLDLNNGVGSVFGSDDILNQPSIERDLISTLLRDPLATSSGSVGNLSVAGSNPRFNGLAIDGALLQDDFGLSSSTYPTNRSPINLDAIESASIVASDYSVKASGFTGGLVNVVTKSGSNEFDGSLFYFRRDEDFQGELAFNEIQPAGDFLEEEYGFTLGGPIIKDKLFFFVSYDEFESAPTRSFIGEDQDDGFNPALFDELNQIVLDNFGIDMGGRPQVVNVPATSERLLAKIDWNINEDHRAFVSYSNTEEGQLSSLSQTEFVSAWYDAPQELEVYTAQINSDWTDRLSTEFRANYKENTRGQICGFPGGGEVSIRLSEADLVGTDLEGFIDNGNGIVDTRDQTFTGVCDRFRHANEFDDERLQLFGAANYIYGDHLISVGGEFENYSLRNLFIERSNGQFTFESLDDLENGNAFVSLRNVPSNNASDGAAVWEYDRFVAFAQDSWQVMPELRVDYGARYEYYSQDDAPQDIPAFREIYGFNSSSNLDGKDLFLPRVGFEYTPFEDTKITGGFGLFAGAEPKVWISNVFQFPVASASGNFTNVDPLTVPEELKTDIANSDLSSLLPIDVISPDFEIPSDWKFSVKLDQRFDVDLNRFGVPLNLGDDYLFTAQYLRTETNYGFRWENLAQTQLADSLPIGTAPDGRPIYANLEHVQTAFDDPATPDVDESSFGVSNVTALTNYEDGSSNVYSVALQNEYDNGVGFFVSYAFQDVEQVTPGTSSRGVSNLRSIRDTDVNNPSTKTSEFEIEHSFKLNLSWETQIFGELDSRFNVFGQVQSGLPYSATFDVFGNDNPTRDNSLFGRPGDSEEPFDNAPLYIPAYSGGAFSDPLVEFSSGFDQEAFLEFADSRGLGSGRISEINGFRSSWNQKWDFQFQQELPLYDWGLSDLDDQKLSFVLDIENVANLLNDEWGTQFGPISNQQAALVRADLISEASIAGYLADNPGATRQDAVDNVDALLADEPRLNCVQATDCVFRYNEFNGFNTDTSDPSESRSVYSIKVGLRYVF